ncbi:hypothetical protein H9P43_002860 [Blastocladiella emersonii ATCC 22665]|nr:hypothetical protein H9P43_002860 [Blastocladiella emersonii ATCC 22665]
MPGPRYTALAAAARPAPVTPMTALPPRGTTTGHAHGHQRHDSGFVSADDYLDLASSSCSGSPPESPTTAAFQPLLVRRQSPVALSAPPPSATASTTRRTESTTSPSLAARLRSPWVTLLLLAVAFPTLLALDRKWLPVPVRIVVLVSLAAVRARACLPPVPSPSSRIASPPRSPLATLATALLPMALWLTLFTLMRRLPSTWLPPVDTETLPRLDTALVGQPAYRYFDAAPSTPKDVVAWLLYGVWHFISIAVCAAGLAYWQWSRSRWLVSAVGQYDGLPTVVPARAPRHPATWTARVSHRVRAAARTARRRFAQIQASVTVMQAFLAVFGSMNLAGVMIQYVAPTAPPWYNEKYGFAVPLDALAVAGDPGGLARIDTLLGTATYKNMFAHSPLVFGAFPSLHAAFATLIAVFLADVFPRTRLPRWTRVKSVPSWLWAVPYVAAVWWATMYLDHHFLTDLLAGSALAVATYLPSRKHVHALRDALADAHGLVLPVALHRR